MSRTARVVITSAALATALSSAVFTQNLPQNLPLGTWSGTVNNRGNRATRPASLELKVVPDPHWRWRGGPRDVMSGTFTAAQDKYEIGTIGLEGGTLSFSFTDTERDRRVACQLKAQPDGSYEGDCTGIGFERRVVLRPPDAPPGPDGDLSSAR